MTSVEREMLDLDHLADRHAAALNNGDTAEVVAIDAEHGRVTVAK